MTVPEPVAMTPQVPDYGYLADTLLCQTQAYPLPLRFRSLFTLKSIGTPEAALIICQGFREQAALLGHELAYCLGQMQLPEAIPCLTDILLDKTRHPMVRHEAGEALGAIGHKESLAALQPLAEDPEEHVSVRETCQIAADKIKRYQTDEVDGHQRQGTLPEGCIAFGTVDPAPAFPWPYATIKELAELYLPSKLAADDDPQHTPTSSSSSPSSLYTRYRALFTLRNMATEQASLAICQGFSDSSALFRHEVAYVLGQLQMPCTVPYLEAVLENEAEVEMVRHEAAEALGSIATDECVEILTRFIEDKEVVVRDSCIVALDMVAIERGQ